MFDPDPQTLAHDGSAVARSAQGTYRPTGDAVWPRRNVGRSRPEAWAPASAPPSHSCESFSPLAATLIELAEQALNGDRSLVAMCLARAAELAAARASTAETQPSSRLSRVATKQDHRDHVDTEEVNDAFASSFLPGAVNAETTEGAANAGAGLASWQVRRITTHIESNLASSLPREELASLVKLSPSHFGRAFKASFGQPPHAYILERRVARAQRLMLTSDAPLSHVATACGLADQAHLCRVFRRIVHQSPKAWCRDRRP